VAKEPSADKIVELQFQFMAAKVFLSAVEFGLFTELAKGPLDRDTLRERLGLHPRAARDFFDTLVTLGVLKRTGDRYANTSASAFYLDKTKPTYAGGIAEMMSARLYQFGGSLTEALKNGRPQNEIKGGENLFEAIYADPQLLKTFLSAMTGTSLPAAKAMAAKFPGASTRPSSMWVARRDACPYKWRLRIRILAEAVSTFRRSGRFSTNISLHSGCGTVCVFIRVIL
jgi:hypothetical protein